MDADLTGKTGGWDEAARSRGVSRSVLRELARGVGSGARRLGGEGRAGKGGARLEAELLRPRALEPEEALEHRPETGEERLQLRADGVARIEPPGELEAGGI